MVITNWRQAAPTIVHQYGIDAVFLLHGCACPKR